MTAERVLNGPGLYPAAGEAARQLVVLLHGYGADGTDLIDLGRFWQALLPNAAFIMSCPGLRIPSTTGA